MDRPDDESATGALRTAEPADAQLDDDSDAGPARADDASQAPEEENQSQLPGDPRKPNEQQPPFKEQY